MFYDSSLSWVALMFYGFGMLTLTGIAFQFGTFHDKSIIVFPAILGLVGVVGLEYHRIVGAIGFCLFMMFVAAQMWPTFDE